MLTTILVLLVVLWLLGMVSWYTLGGFIHLLLVLAVAILLIRVIQGRNPSSDGSAAVRGLSACGGCVSRTDSIAWR